MAFTKSNKTIDVKITQLDKFMTYLTNISTFFSPQ